MGCPHKNYYIFKVYNMLVKKRYSFLLNSKNKIGGTNSNAKYFIDWSKLPQGNYSLHFTYNGGINTLAGSKFGYIAIDCGAVCESNYLNGTSELNMCVLGILKLNSIKNTATTLYADDSTNTCICLANKPSNNQVTIYIYSNDAGNPVLFTDDNAVVPADYLLNIHFDLME
jgi:hypothetical protein